MNHPSTNTPGATTTCTNKDPAGVLGAHPVGTGLGAVGVGAAAGAVGGAVAGPVGAVAGAVVGAVAGGMAGNAAAAALDPTIETKYWKESHASKIYSKGVFGYDEFAPAYRYGWESFGRRTSEDKTFAGVESDLGRGWDKAKGTSRLTWDQAKPATHDAWDRVESAARGDAAPVAR